MEIQCICVSILYFAPYYQTHLVGLLLKTVVVEKVHWDLASQCLCHVSGLWWTGQGSGALYQLMFCHARVQVNVTALGSGPSE